MGNTLFSRNMDIVQVDKNNLLYLRVKKNKEEMTGWERVSFAFTKTEFGELNPEMHRIKDATLISGFVGAIIGSVGRSRIAYMDFFRQHNVTQFETPLQGRAKLQETVVLGMGSGAFRVGWRVAAFTFLYMTGATVISAYRGKYGLLDQVGGGGIAGFCYKFMEGPKAAFSGTVVGGFLGLVAGSISLGVMKLIGVGFEEANMQYYSRLSSRINKELSYVRMAREKVLSKEDEVYELQNLHQALLADMQPANVGEGAKQKEGESGDVKNPAEKATAVDAAIKEKITS